MNLQPHQQRVVDERTQLDDKRSKLATFTVGPVFAGLQEPEKDRLRRQARAMSEYSGVLTERINAFEIPSTPRSSL